MTNAAADLPQPESMLTALRAALGAIVRVHKASLGAVGGNLLIAVPGVQVMTIVTRGPRLGIYDDATDDPIGFALITREEILEQILAGDDDFDPAPHLASGELVMEGDARLFERLLSLGASTGEKGNMLAVRSGENAAAKERRPSSSSRRTLV